MNIREKTVALIDELKATCQSAGLGNDGNEFKIITQVFLYKFLNDKFGYTLKNKDTRYKAQFENVSDWEGEYSKLSEDEQKRVCRAMGADCPNLYSRHLITQLWNQQTKGDFDIIFDSTKKHGWSKENNEFSKKIFNKSKVCIVIENEDGEIFGCYINSIIDKIDKNLYDYFNTQKTKVKHFCKFLHKFSKV